MPLDFSFVLVVGLVLLGIAFPVYMVYLSLNNRMKDLSLEDMEKQKNIKEKRHHMEGRLSKPVNWRVLLSREIQRYLPDHKTEAIIRYRQLTGADVQDATQTIAYHLSYPNHVPARFVHYDLTDEQISSLHKLLRQGKRAEAHRRYQDMTGIDQFAADIGLDILEQQVLIEEERFSHLRDIADTDADEIQEHHMSHTGKKG